MVVSKVSYGLAVTNYVGWCFFCLLTEPAGRIWIFDWVYKEVVSVEEAVAVVLLILMGFCLAIFRYWIKEKERIGVQSKGSEH